MVYAYDPSALFAVAKDNEVDFSILRRVTRSVCSFACFRGEVEDISEEYSYEFCRDAISLVDDEPVDDLECLMDSNLDSGNDNLPLGCEANYFWRQRWIEVDSDEDDDQEPVFEWSSEEEEEYDEDEVQALMMQTWEEVSQVSVWQVLDEEDTISEEEEIVTQGKSDLVEQKILVSNGSETYTVNIGNRAYSWEKDHILTRPLDNSEWKAVLMSKMCNMPFMRQKYLEYEDKLGEAQLALINDQCLLGSCKKGTPEYYSSQLWQSRRDRETWLRTCENASIANRCVTQGLKMRIEDLMQTQGDQNDLEESESVSKFQNVTFVDERPVESVPAHITGDLHLNDTHADISETPWTLNQILERELLIDTHVWKVGDTGNILTLGFPKALIKAGSVVESQLRMCGFLRSSVEIRIVMNGNKFMIGRLLAHIEPIQFSVDNNSHDIVAYPNFPHVFLDASVSNSAVLTIPFCSILTYMSQRAGALEDDSVNSTGRLYIDIFNALQAPEGGSQRLSVTVYARFVKPTIHQTVYAIDKFAYSDGFVTQGGADGQVIVNRAVQPPCFGDDLDNTVHLSLNRQPQRSADMQTLEGSDFNLMEALQIPGLIQQTFWTTSDTEGNVIFSFPVSPNYLGPVNTSVIIGKGTVYRPTFLNYISRCFAYYSGDLMVKIQVIGNAFASGRLLHSFDPTWVPADGVMTGTDEVSNYNCVIQDIQEQQEIVIRIPFMSVRPFLRCDYWKVTSNFDEKTDREKLGESFMGYFRTMVLNDLVMPAQMTQRIEINFYLYAAPNFSLRVPVSLQPLQTDPGSNDFRFPREPVYPIFPYAEKSICYDNRDYIRITWSEGYRLYTASLIKNAAKWWECTPVDGKGEIDEVFAWCYKARQLAQYVTKAQGSQQEKLMTSLGAFGPNFSPKIEESVEEQCSTQGLENFVSSRKSPELTPIVITKGNREQNAPEIENRSLQTFLFRYYPLIVMNPRQALTGFTLIQLPVNPAFTPDFRSPIMKRLGPVPQMNQLAWITKMFGFWSGSLKYKFVFSNTDAEAYVAYIPQDNMPYQINSGVSPQDVQAAMSYAGTIAVTHLQGSIEVTVPFSSPFNQCMVNVRGGHYDSRCQNGTLMFYMRNKLIQQHVQIPAVSIFISAGPDFKLNWLTTPPQVFDSVLEFNCNPEEKREFGFTEPHRYLSTWGHTTRNPQNCGYHEIDSIGEMALCKGPPEGPVTQGLGSVLSELTTPFSFMFNLNNAARSLPAQIEEFNTNVTEVKEAIVKISDKTSSFADKAEQYMELAASSLLAGNVIRSFAKVCSDMTTGNLIDLAVSLATMLGFNVRRQLMECITRVIDCFKVKEQPRAQAMSGAVLDVIEENEDLITKCIAVLGTVLYSYVFDCIPDFTKMKNWLKDFLNAEPVTQGFDLRGAHFGYLGLSALTKVFDNLVHYAKKFIDWLLARDSPETLLARKAETIRERVMKLIADLDELDNEVEVIRALADPLVHNRFYGLVSEVRELTEMYMKGQMDARVGQILTECRIRAKNLVTRLEKEKPTHGWRYDPFVVCIHGETGTGKTAIMREVSKLIAEEMNLPIYNRVYNKTINDDFWSGYSGQSVVHWDEFGQNAQKDGNVAEFIELRGNDPHKLNMAAIEEKGMYFTSKAIIMTTNVPYLSFGTVIRDPQAYLRRRHFMLGMHHAEGFNANVMQQQEGFDPDFTHCNFTWDSNMRRPAHIFPYRKEEIMNFLRQEVGKWHRKQMAMYEEYIMQNGLGTLPRGVIPIVEEVNPEEIAEVREIPEATTPLLPVIEVNDSQGRQYQVLQDLNPKNSCMVMGISDEYYCQVLNAKTFKSMPLKMSCVKISYDFSNCSEDDMNASYINRAAHTFVVIPDLKKAKQSLGSWAQRQCGVLYAKAEKIFQDIKSMIVDVYQKYPKLLIVTAALSTLTAMAATYLLIRSEDPEVEMKKVKSQELTTSNWNAVPEQAYDVHQKKMAVRLIKAENQQYDNVQNKRPFKFVQAENQYYDGAQNKRQIQLVRAEGNEDQNSTDIRKVVHPNLVVIGWAKDSLKSVVLRGLHVCGQVLLVPFHFFSGAREGDKFILLHRLNPIYVEYDQSKLSRIGDKDWCLYDCGSRFEPRRNICKYFIREKALGKLSQVNTLLCNIDVDGAYVIQKGLAKAVVNFRYSDSDTKEQYIQKGWSTNFSTEPGDCGSLLLAMTPAIPAPGKILGIHTAGYVKKSEGFSVLITYEQLTLALQKLSPQVQGLPVPKEVNRSITASDEIRCAPEGDYSIYGSMPNKLAPAQPVKTDFMQTPFESELIADLPNRKKPAHLHPFTDKDGNKVSPLKIALKKYGLATKPFPNKNIKKVKAHLLNEFKNKFQGTEKRLFTENEAIVGIPGIDFADRLNMKSSPGWPYQVLNKKEPGKFYLFDADGKVINEELRKRLDERLKAAKVGERVPSLWRDCLKDELRPCDKVDAGKTRLFTIAPVDYTIVVREYFMDFAINFYGNACNFFSAVGVNPESYEWTKLYNYLAECGNRCIAGDYKSFDGTLMAELMDAVCDVINEWYADGDENALVRKVLINEMIHTMQLVENCVYATHQGNPSGNPLTVIINTIVNYMYLCLVFLEIYPEANLDSFQKHVRAICYGDDVLITVRDVFKNFNFNNIRKILEEHGLGFTTDAKTDGVAPDFVELDSVTFLKRGFRVDSEFGKIYKLPTMSTDTLYSYFHWVRKSEELEEQLQENMRSSLAFAAFHGRTFYNHFHDRWQKCMRSVNYAPICITFEEQVDAFLVSAGAANGCGVDRQFFDNLTEGGDVALSETNPTDKWDYLWKFVKGIGWGVAAFYVVKMFNFVQKQKKKGDELLNVERTNRWAICIPSGEGKTTLARKYPKYFIDVDDLVLFKGEYPAFDVYMKNKVFEQYGCSVEGVANLPLARRLSLAVNVNVWFAEWMRSEDVPTYDRRILLTHTPINTLRSIAGVFVTPDPTGVRNNLAGRELLIKHYNAIELSFEDREKRCVELVQEKEPEVFREEAPIYEIERFVGHFTSRVSN